MSVCVCVCVCDMHICLSAYMIVYMCVSACVHYEYNASVHAGVL